MDALQVQISKHHILYILIDALDSSVSRYWLGDSYSPIMPDGFDPNALEWLDASDRPWRARVHYFAPLVGGQLRFTSCDGDALVLDDKAIARGIAVMAASEQHSAPRRALAHLISGDGDAYTADTFLQCCLLGEVVYG